MPAKTWKIEHIRDSERTILARSPNDTVYVFSTANSDGAENAVEHHFGHPMEFGDWDDCSDWDLTGLPAWLLQEIRITLHAKPERISYVKTWVNENLDLTVAEDDA